ncbi:unnamed protein product, partial [marine sediment metagenome]
MTKRDIKLCPLCDFPTRDTKLIYVDNKNDFKFVQCPNCELFYQPTYLTEVGVVKYYSKKYKHALVSTEYAKTTSRKISFDRFGIEVLGQIPERSKVLDIGCGAGGSSLYLRNTRGCQVECVELSPI